jgi:hypothetical protein
MDVRHCNFSLKGPEHKIRMRNFLASSQNFLRGMISWDRVKILNQIPVSKFEDYCLYSFHILDR